MPHSWMLSRSSPGEINNEKQKRNTKLEQDTGELPLYQPVFSLSWP